MAEGKLQADPLFQGLTRPPMLLGVSYLYFLLNFVVCILIFINTSDFLVLFVMFPAIHGIGYMLCLREPRAIELGAVKFGKTLKCRNRMYHGFTNSYDPY